MSCRCGVPDVRRLRLAMGLSQSELGELLGVTHQTISRHEATPHTCLHPSTAFILRAYAHGPDFRSRIVAAGVALPAAPKERAQARQS